MINTKCSKQIHMNLCTFSKLGLSTGDVRLIASPRWGPRFQSDGNHEVVGLIPHLVTLILHPKELARRPTTGQALRRNISAKPLPTDIFDGDTYPVLKLRVEENQAAGIYRLTTSPKMSDAQRERKRAPMTPSRSLYPFQARSAKSSSPVCVFAGPFKC